MPRRAALVARAMRQPVASTLLHLLIIFAADASTPLQAFQLSVDGDTRGGFVAEAYGTNKIELLSTGGTEQDVERDDSVHDSVSI